MVSRRSSLITATVLLALLVLHVTDVADARPNSRMKRVSDQRLAELETLLALTKMSGQLVTVPLGYGKVNPKMIGRKRRSDVRMYDLLFNRSTEDVEDAGDPADANYEYVENKR